MFRMNPVRLIGEIAFVITFMLTWFGAERDTERNHRIDPFWLTTGGVLVRSVGWGLFSAVAFSAVAYVSRLAWAGAYSVQMPELRPRPDMPSGPAYRVHPVDDPPPRI